MKKILALIIVFSLVSCYAEKRGDLDSTRKSYLDDEKELAQCLKTLDRWMKQAQRHGASQVEGLKDMPWFQQKQQRVHDLQIEKDSLEKRLRVLGSREM